MNAEEDLAAIANRTVEACRHFSGEAEAYAQRSQTTDIKVYEGNVESLTTAEQRGIGVRFIRSGRQGYSYTSDLSEAGIEEAAAAAAENASVGGADEWTRLPDAAGEYPGITGLWRAGVPGMPIEQKIDLAGEAERTARSVPDISIVEEAVYADVSQDVALASTKGMDAYRRATFCYVYVSALARRNEDVQTGFGVTAGREPDELDPAAAGAEAAEKARALLGASPCSSGRYTVVFDRQVFAAVLSILGHALSGEAVLKGRSMFVGRMGERVAASGFDLIDDGLDAEGPNGAPFDDEGVPQQHTPLIEDGYLQSWLHSTYTAQRQGEGGSSTGNASRGSYRSPPGVSTTNLKIRPGSGELPDLCGRVGDGLYVTEVKGLHSGANPASGDFSVGAGGHVIKGGALDAPVREITIATDLPTLLERVVDAAGDALWVPMYGGVYSPSVAVEGITVSGR